MGGSTTVGATGLYGKQNLAAAENVPGARQAAVSWVDSAGRFWVLGGYGDLGVSAAGNVPGARFQSVGWIDSADHLGLFGGYGLDDSTNDYYGPLNDLFEY